MNNQNDSNAISEISLETRELKTMGKQRSTPSEQILLGPNSCSRLNQGSPWALCWVELRTARDFLGGQVPGFPWLPQGSYQSVEAAPLGQGYELISSGTY